MLSETLARKQQDANSVIALNVKSISATSFYTALPQLISRVIHDDEDTARVVREILRRVLTKIPDKAMWPLAWLRGSRDTERAKIGEQIFRDAEATYPEGHKMHSLLKASSSLFKYLQSLAT
jgi:serine/threonine-protein kinase ATR